MKFRFKIAMYLLLFLSAIFEMNAQEVTVKGVVSDDIGPLPGVNVIVKNTSRGTETDAEGKYTIKVKQGDVLVFSFVGMKTVEKIVGISNTIDLTMESDSVLDEVVVVAYGTTTKEALTGSVNIVGAEDLELRNVTSPLAAVEGRVTGVQFTSTNGQPGSTPNLVIRGVGTLNGSTTPLFIVDGVQYEGSIAAINQDDIKSFTVLKDAASTSLYGARAANGVVIITTKSGTKGEIKVSASVQSGVVSRANPLYDQVSPEQYYETMWEALKNSSAGGGDPAFASANIYNQLGYNPFNVPNDQIVGTDGKINPNARVIYNSLDWVDFMERVGFRQNYSMNVSGGGENHQVFFSASYLDEEGYVLKTKFDRLTARLNGSFDVSKRIKIGGSANLAITEAVGPSSAGANSIVNPFAFANRIGSIYPVFVNDRKGNLVLDNEGNPVFDSGEGFPQYNIGSRPRNQGRHALQELLLNDERNKDNTYGFRVFTDYEVIDGLNLRLTYGSDVTEDLQKQYENNIIGDAQPDGRYSEERLRRNTQTFNQILTYKKSFADHNFEVTLGHESFKDNYSENSGTATVQTTAGIFEFANFSNIVSLGGFTAQKTIEGYFSRLNYNFDNKYFLSGSYRRDASSVFSSESRWGNFYSVGASWNIHKENFMKNLSFLDVLKLRSSWGEVGNDALGDGGDPRINDWFIYQARFGIIPNAGDGGFVLSNLGNRDLKWETIENFDVALEFALFNNTIEGSFEYYKRNSTDLLFELPIAPSIGINVRPENIADMVNSGLEMSLTGHIFKNRNFNWDITLQASTNRNEITSIPDPFINVTKRWAEGRSRFDFYLFKTAGVDPANGDQLFYKYELDANGESVPVLDANGNIETTNDWTDTERVYTGDTSVPDLVGSVANTFSYKGISLGFLINYGVGGTALDGGYATLMHSGAYGDAFHPDILNAWKQPGDITNVPRLENGNPNLVPPNTDRFLTDASFWALRNVNISYTFDRELLKKYSIDALRLSLTGENLYLNSKRRGFNPQFNFAGTPQGNDFATAKTISLGLNVSF